MHLIDLVVFIIIESLDIFDFNLYLFSIIRLLINDHQLIILTLIYVKLNWAY